MPPADPTRFILVNTSHAGNIGAAARAIKVMGFGALVLVAPRFPDVLCHEDTVAMASGAADVLARARVVATLAEALDGVACACATAMTPRDFGPPTRRRASCCRRSPGARRRSASCSARSATASPTRTCTAAMPA
jgi:tRNA/rRNA methyltransferase